MSSASHTTVLGVVWGACTH